MLPYYLCDKEEAKHFITKYKVSTIDNSVTVYYADSSEISLPYSLEVKEKLNEQMEKQVKSIKENSIKRIEDEDKERTVEGFPWALSFALAINFIKNDLFIMLPLMLSSYGLFLVVSKKVMLDNLLNDIHKNKMYVQEKALFCKLDKFNPKLLKGVSGKAKKKINQSEEKNPLDINFIDDISYRDLLKIRENINNNFDKEIGCSKRLGI